MWVSLQAAGSCGDNVGAGQGCGYRHSELTDLNSVSYMH
jgi:hypothetical protein